MKTLIMNRSVFLIPSIVIAIQVFSACGLRKSTSSHDASTSFGPGSTGIKTSSTLIASIEKVTGVSQLTNTGVDSNLPISAQVILSVGFLSKSSDLGSLSSTHVLVATALGSAFAREQIRREAVVTADKRTLCGDVDFSKAPADGLTDSVVTKLIGKFSHQYLQRDPEPSELSSMHDCVKGVASDLGDGGTPDSRSLATQQTISSCIATAYLGSADFMRQ